MSEENISTPQRKRETLDPLSLFAIFTVWFAAVFDPIGNVFGLRFVALIIALSTIILRLKLTKSSLNKTNLREIAILYTLAIMPIYGFLLYFIRGGYHSALLDTSYLAAGVLLSFSLLYHNRQACNFGIRSMLILLRALSIIILAVFISSLIGFSTAWKDFFVEHSVALINTREWIGLQFPYIYFLTSPMLIFLLGHDLHALSNKANPLHILACISSIISLALSGTRAHFAIAILYPIIHFTYYNRSNYKILCAMCIVGFGFLTLITCSTLSKEFLATDETNNAAKIGMFPVYWQIFSDPTVFLFGQGYNAHAWSPEARSIISTEIGASKTELTYIELIRVYGLVCSLPFFWILYKTVSKSRKLPKEQQWIFLSVIIYLANCALNPYLFSTNGMLPLGLILALIYSHNREPNQTIKTI